MKDTSYHLLPDLMSVEYNCTLYNQQYATSCHDDSINSISAKSNCATHWHSDEAVGASANYCVIVNVLAGITTSVFKYSTYFK